MEHSVTEYSAKTSQEAAHLNGLVPGAGHNLAVVGAESHREHILQHNTPTSPPPFPCHRQHWGGAQRGEGEREREREDPLPNT